MEGLLKHAVKKVVKRERWRSSGSADSRGQSLEVEIAEGGGSSGKLPGVGFVKRDNSDATTPVGVLWRLWAVKVVVEGEGRRRERRGR